MLHNTKDIAITHMSLFPTKNSLAEAVGDIEDSLGEEQAKKIFPLIMSYHNTLLKELSAHVANDATAPTNDPKVTSLLKYRIDKASKSAK